ncbi:hypothetical protein OE88DRAFT_1432864 [Heliocybe sulcata]|uniref:Uncharacterized protein n=1 Tax=Heliocybe sulcata TaxID=5364 RepID=A0A5C3N5G2_9AGAM|nr:hypothetical protein OE88DRAFT_1432864 [Heliocybe sulcata]
MNSLAMASKVASMRMEDGARGKHTVQRKAHRLVRLRFPTINSAGDLRHEFTSRRAHTTLYNHASMVSTAAVRQKTSSRFQVPQSRPDVSCLSDRRASRQSDSLQVVSHLIGATTLSAP